MKREGRLYGALLASTSVLLVAGGAVALVYTLAAFIGPFDALRSDGPARVAVRADAGGGDLGFARALGADPARAGVTVQELVHGASVVVVPDVDSLPPDERASLRAFVAAGGGAVIGVRSAAPRGGGSSPEFPAPVHARALPADTWVALAPHGRGPVAAAFHAGGRTAVPGSPRVGLGEAGGDLCWVPAVGDAGWCLSAAAGRYELGRGRAVWLTIAPDDAPDATEDRATLERVARAAAAWAGRRPFVELRSPEPGDPGVPGVRLRAEDLGRDRVLLDVTNTASETAHEVALRVHLNALGRTATVRETKLFQPNAVSEPVPGDARDGDALDVRIPAVPAGVTRSFQLDLQDGEVGS